MKNQTKPIGTIVDGIAAETQKMYGGENPPEIYARNLERLAKSLRCYGADAGLALLIGRLCAMMEFAPRQGAQFAQEVAKCREESCVGFLEAINPNANTQQAYPKGRWS